MLPDTLTMDMWTRVWWSARKYVINCRMNSCNTSPCCWDMDKLFHHHMGSKFHISLSVHHT